MAVYVKRNGLVGAAYMAAIAPFRHLIVHADDPRDRAELAGARRRSGRAQQMTGPIFVTLFVSSLSATWFSESAVASGAALQPLLY